jgi:hypothetical protein
MYQCQLGERVESFENFEQLREFARKNPRSYNHSQVECSDEESDGLTDDERVGIQEALYEAQR